jgi:cell division septum initiation protein DivIVA
MRGYDPGAVDEFLDSVAESIQSYVQSAREYERTIEEQAEKLHDYEKIKGSLHEALLMAQRAAEEKVSNAARVADERLSDAAAKADGIVADARAMADRMIREAEDDIARYSEELKKLQQLREYGFSYIRWFIDEMRTTIDRAESDGHIDIPEFAHGVMKKRREARRPEPQPSENSFGAPSQDTSSERSDEAKRMDISSTLNALGIDPSLIMNTDI